MKRRDCANGWTLARLARGMLLPIAALAAANGFAEPAWIDVEPQILPVAVAEDEMTLGGSVFDTWWRIDFALAPCRRGSVFVVR